ncbi:MAG: carbohydrate kinase family protein, partial [Chloroflexaceae bacterium]|nr:carbohydrate kinase family protein [Chloroflexaceae bacterium]
MEQQPSPKMTTAARRITLIGDIFADLTLALPYYPREGGDVTANALAWTSGGTGVNAAVTYAMLQCDVRLLGRIGTDPAAAVALRAAHHAAIDMGGIQIDTLHPTGTCVVELTDGGRRTLLAHRGANMFYTLDAISYQALNSSDMLHISAYTLLGGPQRTAMLRAIALVEQQQIPIVLDLATGPTALQRDTIFQLLPRLSLLMMN